MTQDTNTTSGAADLRAEVAMIDAAMVEMTNITPPLKRSECARLLRAALAAGQATAARVVASSAVMSAIRDANMQLVRTGDDAFILAPYKSADAAPVQPAAGPANDDAMPAAQQPGAAYAALPECSAFLLCKGSGVTARAWNVDQMRAFADATCAIRAPHAQAPAGATLPEGWVPLVITHEGQYPEEVAYGPQRMMDRLGKWLRKYFDFVAAAKEQPEPAADLQEDQTQPWYDLAWKHGARRHASFDGDELTELSFRPAQFDAFCAELAPSAGAVAPAAVAGCTRSHPHENMDSACREKAAIAEMRSMAARGAEATAQDLERFVAMLAAQPAGAQQPGAALELLKFYGVTTDAELIAAQARHIERLQARLPQPPSFAPQRVREG